MLAKQPWTHHHAHRLFHISLGLCFAFILVTILMGLMVVWLGHADPPPVSHDVSITATVAGITPGPIDNGGGPAPVPPNQNPTITIVAEPQGVIPQTGGVYVFVDRIPAFSGHTSVPGGLIFISIAGPQVLNSSAIADGQGNWYWQSPAKLDLGSYAITATVYNRNDFSKSGHVTANFAVETNLQTNQPNNGNQGTPGNNGQPGKPGTGRPGTGGITLPPAPGTSRLFGVFFKVLPEYERVLAGNKVVGQLTLVNKLSNQETNQEISYKISGPDGKVVMESQDNITYSKVANFLKTFYTAPATAPGRYTIVVTTSYNGIISTASDTFNLEQVFPAAPTQREINGPVILWGGLAGLLMLFLFLVLVAYYQVRLVSRHIREHNEKYHKEDENTPPQ